MEQSENYEFTEEQNVVVGGLAQKMKYVGIIGVIIGIVYVVSGIVNKTNAILGIFNIIIGIWTINASKSFQLVVDTQGNDIKNLMDALAVLKKLFNLQFWAYIVAVCMIFLAIIVLLLVGQSSEIFKLLQ